MRTSHAVSALLLVVAACGGDEHGTGTTSEATSPATSTDAPTTSAARPTTEPSTTLGAIAAGTGPIEPGTYRVAKSAWSFVDFTVTIPEGWSVQYGHVYQKHYDTDDEFGFYAVMVDAIHADPCAGTSGELMEVGPSAEDLAEALLQQPGPVASRRDTTFGGYPAIAITLGVPDGYDLRACNIGEIGLQIWYSVPADKHFVLLSTGPALVYIVDVDGRRQVFVAQLRSNTSIEDFRELEAVLRSIRIET
jgi:hypothetical protein